MSDPAGTATVPDSNSSLSAAEKAENDELLNQFYAEMKSIDKTNATITPKQQIDRLNRPGSTYFNLNPYDVLQIEPETPQAEVTKRYRAMARFVHPDRNPDDAERAQRAFEAVNKAYKILESDSGYRKCQEVVDEAKRLVDEMVAEKRKKARKEGRREVEEDDPTKYKHAVYVQVCKLFADLERLRVIEEAREANDRKRKAEEMQLEKEKRELQKEWDTNYEESRTDRVSSWRDFTGATKKKKTKYGHTSFRPPKTKMEQRPE